MNTTTYYVALPFVETDDGPVPCGPIECQSGHEAIRKAELLSQTMGNLGAVAFSRRGEPHTGEFSDAVVLKAFGDVPKNLSGF